MNTTNALPVLLQNADGNKYSFVPNDEGMFNLTEMWRILELPASKKPSQWRNSIARDLERDANLHFTQGKDAYTLATETACIAYAMWVSVSFYRMVVSTFIAVRNDDRLAAMVYRNMESEYQEMLDNNCAKLNAYNRLDKSYQGWHNSCCLAGIEDSRKARFYLWTEYLMWSEQTIKGKTSIAMKASGINAGFIVNRGNGKIDDSICMKAYGRKWLIEHAAEINAATKMMRKCST
jgi:hypothetical protein